MGRHAGRRARRASPARVLSAILGMVVAAGAWLYLVSAAITFGVLARSGTGAAWWLTGLAGTGAAACLLVALILAARLLRELGVLGTGPRARGGGRRASR